MKKKKLITTTSLLLTSTLMLGACTKDNENTETSDKKNDGKVSNIKGDTTIKEIKARYGELEKDDTKVMPFYNVEQNKEFLFDLAINLPDGVLPSDVASVHTHESGSDKSKVLSSVWANTAIGEGEKATLSIKPIGAGVLASNTTLNNEGSSWGNAPIYYIKLNYNVYGNMEKLDEPIIIPFTVKSDVPVPNVNYEIEKGQLKLTWEEVEGAESYNIYRVSKTSLLEQTNIEQSGAETGYKGTPLLVDSVSKGTTVYIDEDAINSPFEDSTIYQNAGVNGDFYVTAVIDGKESNFSKEISTVPLSKQLPKELAKDEPLKSTTYKTVDELPSSVDILFIDGSVSKLPVTYEFVEGEDYALYFVKNTHLKGKVYVDELDKKALEEKVKNEQNSTSGYVEPTNSSDQVPNASIPTIIETESSSTSTTTKEEPLEEEKVKEEPKEESIDTTNEDVKEDKIEENTLQDDLTEKQKENTEKIIEEGNKEEVVTPEIVKDGDYVINADTAFEEYLAMKLINGDTNISLKAFPEAQNLTFLEDTFLKVMYQNPMIIGVAAYAYDYSGLNLEVMYEYDNAEIKSKQKEIVKEANKIVKDVVKDSMTDDEKRLALYDYLNDNTKYDDAALENAEKNNFVDVDAQFNDSFNTYGIMVKKVGVCASYAATYQMLLDLAGVESVVVTGDLNGLPHAWNKVQIEDEWYHVDTTNNEVNSGIPYMAYQLSDEVAQNVGLNSDKAYWLDNELSKFVGTNKKFDYYEMNDLNATNEQEFKDALEKAIKAKNDYIIIRLDNYKATDNELLEDAAEVINKTIPEKLETAQFMSDGTFVLIQLN